MLARIQILMLAVAVSAAAAAAPAHAPVSARTIARTCVTCHQPTGKAIPEVPGDMNEAELLEKLKTLKDGDNTVMRRIVGGIDDRSMKALAELLTEPQP